MLTAAAIATALAVFLSFNSCRIALVNSLVCEG